MPLLAEHIVEAGGAAGELRILDAEFGKALLDEAAQASGLADTGQVALHVGHEARHAGLAEGLGQHLEGHGLARARGTGDEAVAVGHLAYDADGTLRAVSNV